MESLDKFHDRKGVMYLGMHSASDVRRYRKSLKNPGNGDAPSFSVIFLRKNIMLTKKQIKKARKIKTAQKIRNEKRTAKRQSLEALQSQWEKIETVLDGDGFLDFSRWEDFDQMRNCPVKILTER